MNGSQQSPSAPPTVTWAPPGAPEVIGVRCPNCGGIAAKPPLLGVQFHTPDGRPRQDTILNCRECGCRFYRDQMVPDYAEDLMLLQGRVPFYLQQGAGLALITRPLARIDKPPGSRYVEVGCGFGFALDFAARVKQWRVQGIDPAQVAALGREMLGVPIDLRYLDDDEPELALSCDVVMASETIEHVTSPPGFLRTLRRVLKPGGILVLTTPDAADLDPATAPEILIGLLSPGFHMTFQTRATLAAVLRLVGFSQVLVEKDGHSLVAYASDQQFSLDADLGRTRASYRGYLEQRQGDFPAGHDLNIGFSGRALMEAASDRDTATAARQFALLAASCRTRFGLDIETMTAIPGEAAHCSLERLAEIMPLSLGCVLYFDAMRRVAQGESRSAMRPRLLCAIDAADALRRATAELSAEDALSAEVAWTLRAELVVEAAAEGAADIVEQVLAIPRFPGTDQQRRTDKVLQTLVTLVNAGSYALGRALAGAAGLQDAAWANPAKAALTASETAGERDALFCLAMLDLQPGGDMARAGRRFGAVCDRLRGAAGPVSGLFWAALRGQVQACSHTDGQAAAAAVLDRALDGLAVPDSEIPTDLRPARRNTGPAQRNTGNVSA